MRKHGNLTREMAGYRFRAKPAVIILDPDFPASHSDEAANLIPAGANNWCGEVKNKNNCEHEPWASRRDSQNLFALAVGIVTTTNRRNKTNANAVITIA
jgi:hypothetical protein